MSDHKFFRNFGYKPTKITKRMPEEMQNNLFIMEICNNWDIIKDLMKNHKEGTLGKRRLDMIDQGWIANLTQNNIDLESFSSSDEFYEKYIK